jgi:hypothetical protein
MGAYHFPQDAAVTELEASAKKGAGANLLDPLRFGRWRDGSARSPARQNGIESDVRCYPANLTVL